MTNNKPGYKNDEDKIRMDLIPPELLTAVATILTIGAKTYGDRNWENGMSWNRVYAALLRHLNAWQAGEESDPETGKSHLWHAGCCIAFLIAYEARSIGIDDRPDIGKVEESPGIYFGSESVISSYCIDDYTVVDNDFPYGNTPVSTITYQESQMTQNKKKRMLDEDH